MRKRREFFFFLRWYPGCYPRGGVVHLICFWRRWSAFHTRPHTLKRITHSKHGADHVVFLGSFLGYPSTGATLRNPFPPSREKSPSYTRRLCPPLSREGSVRPLHGKVLPPHGSSQDRQTCSAVPRCRHSHPEGTPFCLGGVPVLSTGVGCTLGRAPRRSQTTLGGPPPQY